MSLIEKIRALEILDSRGTPTVRVFVETKDRIIGSSSVPSGASTGENEALELRDKDPKRYFGKGVLHVIKNIEGPIFSALRGVSVLEQQKIDAILCSLDGTKNKSFLGANALLGVSMAVAVAASKTKKLPLFRSLREKSQYILPCPMMNIINGGVHAANLLSFQEFMIRPKQAASFKEALRMGSESFHSLKRLLQEKNLSTAVGDEGGFAPAFSSAEEALDFLCSAIEKTGFSLGKQISLSLDVAASEFFKAPYYVEKNTTTKKSYKEMILYLEKLCNQYPIDSIEDGLDQNDWEGWALLTKKLGKKIQLVGDDLFVTNPFFLKKGIEAKCANAILIKLNQIGTVSETLATIDLAQKKGYSVIISHRSGETEDTFIADLAVAVNAGQIKTGSLSRSERTAKYNRLLEIEAYLDKQSSYQDGNPFSR